jgi:hypothetical protein
MGASIDWVFLIGKFTRVSITEEMFIDVCVMIIEIVESHNVSGGLACSHFVRRIIF